MAPLVRIHWPTDTTAQLIEFRANVYACAVASLLFPLGVIFMMLHRDPDIRVLLGGLAIGTLLATWWTLGKPPTPFRATWTTPRPVSELGEDARRVLSFLRSDAARRLALTTAVVVDGVIVVAALVDWSVIQGRSLVPMTLPLIPIRTGELHLSGVIGCVALCHLLLLFGLQLAVLHAWIARHLSEFLTTYPPWPKDRPF